MSNTDPNQIVVPASTVTTTAPPAYVQTGNTGTGFITGVDPATVRQTSQQPPQPNGPSADEVAAAVGEKINPVIEQQGQTVAEMQQRMEAMQTEIDAAHKAARSCRPSTSRRRSWPRVAAEQAVEEEKLSATELVAKVRGEMQSEFDTLQRRVSRQGCDPRSGAPLQRSVRVPALAVSPTRRSPRR